MMAADPQKAASLLEITEQKSERLGKLLKIAIEENGNGNIYDDDSEDETLRSYKKNVSYVVNNLKIISELELNTGQKILMDVQGQADSQAKIENAINEVNSRSGFVKFLIGPKYKDIKSLKIEILANQARIRTLNDATNRMIDPAARFVLKKQISIFIRENDKMRAFVAEKERGASLFGWLVKLFS